MKLFTGILKERLETQITNREEKQGFRRNRSTTDAIFIIKQLKEKSIEFNNRLHSVLPAVLKRNNVRRFLMQF